MNTIFMEREYVFFLMHTVLVSIQLYYFQITLHINTRVLI
jgi:hypothetical protein